MMANCRGQPRPSPVEGVAVTHQTGTGAPGPAEGQPARRHFAARVVPSDEGHGVTTLELFFDLVFVFAITQVTAFMADELGWRGVLRGLVLLALLWWAWCSYAWLGNQAHADEGIVRVAVIVAMAAMFLVALAIPEAWGDEGAGSARLSSWPSPGVWSGWSTWPSTPWLRAATPLCGGNCCARRPRSSRRWVCSWSARCSADGADGPLGAGAGHRLRRRLRRGNGLAPAGTAPLRRAARADPDHRAGGVAHRRRRRGRRPAAHRPHDRGRDARPGGRRGAVVVLLRRGRPRGGAGAREPDGHRPGPAGAGLVHLPALPDGRRSHLPGSGAEEGRGVRRPTPRTTRWPTRCRRPPSGRSSPASPSTCSGTWASGCATSGRSTVRGPSSPSSCSWHRCWSGNYRRWPRSVCWRASWSR